MAEKKSHSTLSANVVKYLVGEGYTQREIARLMQVTESYISHAVKGNRNFTVTHLERLAETLEMTVPELLARATPAESVRPKLRKGYQLLLKGLRASAELRAALGRSSPKRKEAVGV